MIVGHIFILLRDKLVHGPKIFGQVQGVGHPGVQALQLGVVGNVRPENHRTTSG